IDFVPLECRVLEIKARQRRLAPLLSTSRQRRAVPVGCSGIARRGSRAKPEHIPRFTFSRSQKRHSHLAGDFMTSLKRIVPVTLCLVSALVLSACGDSSSASNLQHVQTASQQKTQDAPKAATP